MPFVAVKLLILVTDRFEGFFGLRLSLDVSLVACSKTEEASRLIVYMFASKEKLGCCLRCQQWVPSHLEA